METLRGEGRKATAGTTARYGLVKNRHPFDEACTKVVARLSPVNNSMVRTESGDTVPLDVLSKEDLVKRYRILQQRYNTLVARLSSLVGV